MQRVQNPLPQWNDQRGALLDAGRIYIGVSGNDPEDEPIEVFWDAAGTIRAQQPLRTRGGFVVNNGAPAQFYVAAEDYSLRVRDSDNALVLFSPSVVGPLVAAGDSSGGGSGAAYQPYDLDLTLLSGIGSTAYGRALLTLLNQAALRAAVGYVAGLPLTGGTVSGNILRQGAGPHVYHNDPAMTAGAIFVTADGATDPTTLPGQIWLTY